MNIHQNASKIQSLLHDGWRASTSSKGVLSSKKTFNTGIYILAQSEKSDFHKLGTAYGETRGLYGRIMNYKLCYSKIETEFWLKYMVISPEVRKSGKKKAAQFLEETMLAAINSRAKESYSKEWLVNKDESKLEEIMLKTLHAHRNLWTHAVKFTRNGFLIIDSAEGKKSLSFKNRQPTWSTNAINGVVTKQTKKNTTSISEAEWDGSEGMVQMPTKAPNKRMMDTLARAVSTFTTPRSSKRKPQTTKKYTEYRKRFKKK